MTSWTTTTLVAIADDYDREMSDTGAPLDSRLGRYLAQHMDDLWDEDRTDPKAFLVWAWRVATGPIMSPGYVRIRPDLGAVRLTQSQEDGRLLVEIETPVGHGQLAQSVRPPYSAMRDWEIDRYAYSSDGSHLPLQAPEDESKPALLLAATLRLPADDWTLHQPAGKWPVEELLIDDAKNALAVAVTGINDIAGHRVAKLIGSEGGRW
ncbi:hypothetical protein [Streptomyces sp. NPDC013489]|uniref:hypothetical protein n=1 Tax=Streptomyces sp. NPDC013489 TaxID=3155606 RepID=UPI0033D5E486